ncbi:MAG: RNA methyltransferase [Candidatus Heimdallarchaeota archaeon]|nr:RNA methyltransferase [Candidatus Heimdallarchaeota archaeon]
MAIKIVLVEPSVSGNIGSTARVMKNFGFKELILINPQANFTDDVFRFAMHAEDILDNIKIYATLEEFLETVQYIVGTTARLSSDKGAIDARIAVSSTDPSLINLLEFNGDIALLFGREDSGLTNREINLCDMTIHIPTVEEYKALNLAQSVAILLYTLHTLKKKVLKVNYRSATKKEKEVLIEWFIKATSVLKIPDWRVEHLVRRFKNIIGRAFVSGKEANSLVSVFSRTYNYISENEAKRNDLIDK